MANRIVSTLVGLAVTAGLVWLAADTWQTRNRDTAVTEGGLLLPDLRARINDTARVRGVNQDGPLTLERRDGIWVVAERGGYRANQAYVSQLLAGLSQLEKIEPKTSRPDRYARIGLEEPGSEGSRARQYTVEDAAGTALATVIIGDDKPARSSPSDTEYYVRLPGEEQTWLVQGALPRTSGTVDWLDDALLDLDINRLARVEVEHADGSRLAVVHTPGTDDGWTLQDIPEGREVENTILVRNVATGLTSFPFEDVAASSPQARPATPDVTIRLTTHDGLVVTMTGVREGEDLNHLWFSATYDAAIAVHVAPDGEAADSGIVRLDEAGVRAEVERLNAAWSPWRFEVGNWRIATADKRTEDFLKALPAAGTGTDASTSGG